MVAQGSWVAGGQDFRGFEMVEAGVLVTLAAMSPEPGDGGGNREAVAIEARPGQGDPAYGRVCLASLSIANIFRPASLVRSMSPS